MPETSQTLLDIDDEMRSRVERLASDRRQPVHMLVREALVQFVEREERGAQFRQDALNAWDDYQATGLHATADEVDEWLRRLESGEAVAPPECHG